MRTKALREQRANIITNAKALIDVDAPSAEALEQFDAAMVEADRINAQIERIERSNALAAELAEVHGARAEVRGVSVDEQRETVAHDKRMLLAYMRGGMAALSAEDRTLVARRASEWQAAATTGTPGAGGYIIAPDFMRELLIAMKAQGGMREAARTISTDTGVNLPWPTMDDRNQVATIVGENTTITADTDLSFGSITLGGYTYKSGLLPVSLQLLQDAAFDFDTLIRDAVAGRFVRGQNAHFTTGSGTGQPQGLVTATPVGRQGTTGQTASVVFDDLIELEHSVDPVYRKGGVYMMHDSSLKVIRKLKDSYGRPLWEASYRDGAPDTINGYPYVINQDMPVMAANAKSILFGNYSSYIIRDILGMQMMRLNERFADNLQVAFLAFMRTDGRFVSAAAPVQAYQNSAT